MATIALDDSSDICLFTGTYSSTNSYNFLCSQTMINPSKDDSRTSIFNESACRRLMKSKFQDRRRAAIEPIHRPPQSIETEWLRTYCAGTNQ